MTDNDIVKALEHCANYKNHTVSCIDCPLCGKCDINSIEQFALDLIKRQQAEIERLEVELKAMRGAANSYKLHYDTIIKEFAAKLKSNSCKLTKYDEGGWDMDVNAVCVYDIDNLVNEMTEEEHNESN